MQLYDSAAMVTRGASGLGEATARQRVVYGLLGLSMLTGLLDRTGLISNGAIAMPGIRDWQFCPPLFIGDMLKSRDEVVQEGHIDIMVGARTGVAV
jgi:hypothetical protein